MQGLGFYYKNKKNASINVTNSIPQYIYLNPYQKLIVRYYLTNVSLEVTNLPLLNQVVEPDILSVKIRHPTSNIISKISDFKNIPERDSDTETSEISFDKSDTYILDVLYESKINSRLKVKVHTIDTGSDSFENENTVTDGPDEFVKTVDVSIEYERVNVTYVFRRSGRLKKVPTMASYERLADILLDRLFNPKNPDSAFSSVTIQKEIIAKGWLIDVSGKSIYQMVNNRKIPIATSDIADVIRDKGPASEILNLLKTIDVNSSRHPLILEGANYLITCDKVCSLPEATPQTIIDIRK